VQQIGDFLSGARRDAFGMKAIAQATAGEDIRDAAEWFESLKTGRWVKVVERDTVPKSYLGPGRMRFEQPEGGMEPIGNRIIELPEDAVRARSRDPHSGFIAYVPRGSIAKGAALAKTGGSGRTLKCDNCHGKGLKGSDQAPRLAGVHPIYLARQLYNFQGGANGGDAAQSMKQVVANLSDDDIIALAAYAAAQAP